MKRMHWSPATRLARHTATVLISLLLGAVAAEADITYNVDRTIGSASAVGFIQTDGNTGTLSLSDIVDWNLNLINGPYSWDLEGPTSGNNSAVYLVGSDVTASATQLFFNFSGTDDGYFLFQTGPHNGDTYYCDATFNGICVQGESITPTYYLGPGFANFPQTGNQVIGNVGRVPEPSYSLLLAVLLGLGLIGRLRLKVFNRVIRG